MGYERKKFKHSLAFDSTSEVASKNRVADTALIVTSTVSSQPYDLPMQKYILRISVVINDSPLS
jgi:hypothetical protein